MIKNMHFNETQNIPVFAFNLRCFRFAHVIQLCNSIFIHSLVLCTISVPLQDDLFSWRASITQIHTHTRTQMCIQQIFCCIARSLHFRIDAWILQQTLAHSDWCAVAVVGSFLFFLFYSMDYFSSKRSCEDKPSKQPIIYNYKQIQMSLHALNSSCYLSPYLLVRFAYLFYDISFGE